MIPNSILLFVFLSTNYYYYYFQRTGFSLAQKKKVKRGEDILSLKNKDFISLYCFQ